MIFFDIIKVISDLSLINVKTPNYRAYQPVAVTCKRYLSDTSSTSFARGIFMGELREEELFPYPDVLSEEQKETVSMMMEAGHAFFQVKIINKLLWAILVKVHLKFEMMIMTCILN